MKKKIFIGILMISVIMVLVIGFVCIYFYDSIFYESRDIEFNYLCEIPISSNMEDIGLIKYSSPRLRYISVSEYEELFGEVLDKAELSEAEIHNIKSMIENLPDDKYLYISIQYKLEGVYYSEQPGCYGHNGIYSTQEYDEIFIYWADEPLGNVIDGYV